MLHIKLNRKEFLKKLQIVENAIVEDKTNSINSGILLETSDNKLTLKAMGEGLFIKAQMNCSVLREGAIILKHKTMEEFLKQLEEEEIEVEEKSGKIHIISKNSSSNYLIYQFEKRAEPQLGIGLEYEFSRENLLNNIEKVKFASSINNDHAALSCIRVEIKTDEIRFVASDPHRLIFLKDTINFFDNQESISISIPLRSVNGLIKIMKILEDEKVIFKSEGSRVSFKFNEVEIITKLVELPYPDYRSLLTNIKSNKKILMNIKDFTSILRRISVFVKDRKDKKDVAVFNFSNNKLEVVGEGEASQSETKENLNIIYSGENCKIALNVKYLLDYVQTISEHNILEIKMFDEKTPVLLGIEDNENTQYIVAPTHI